MQRYQGNVAVADDDAKIRKVLAHALSKEGYAVFQASSGAELREILSAEAINLILLDLNLGDEDGLDIAKDLSHRDDIGVIIITGKGDLFDRVIGLEMGADDYLPKPFHLREVLARVKSVLRRVKAVIEGPGKTSESAISATQIRFGALTLDPTSRRLTHNESGDVDLTSAEFSLLHALAQNPNRVLTRDQLLDHTTGRKWTPYDRSIDTLIARLRKKIEPDASQPRYIKSIRGVGYVLAALREYPKD